MIGFDALLDSKCGTNMYMKVYQTEVYGGCKKLGPV